MTAVSAPEKDSTSSLDFNPAGECTLCYDGKLVLELSQDMLRSMKRLKRTLQSCQTCPQNNACAVLEIFHRQVRLAAREILVDDAQPFQAAPLL